MLCRLFPNLPWCKTDEPTVPTEPPPQGERAAECVEAHADLRIRHGLPVLEGDQCLANQAQRHAEDMHRSGTLSHAGFADRVAACERGFAGENVAAGYETGKDVVDGWMGSSGHRANILKSSYNRIGVGVSGNWWCAIYAAV